MTEFELICDGKVWVQSGLVIISGLGSIASSGLHYFTDKYGRLWTGYVSTIISVFAILGASFSNSVYLCMVINFIIGTSTAYRVVPD